jgi:hypothetical protein
MNSPHYIVFARRQPPAAAVPGLLAQRACCISFPLRFLARAWLADKGSALIALALGLVACLCLGGCQPNESLMPDTRLLELADDPNCPIVFDQEAGEFQLVIHTYIDGETVERRIPLRFSPRTGQTLPSQRSPRIRPPSPAEMSRLTEQLKTVRTLADVQAVLGDSESLLIQLASDPHSPVTYSERAAEFSLRYESVGPRGHHIHSPTWSYSPFTGRPLPSRSAEMWMTPAPEDVAMVKATLHNVRSFTEVEAAWGPPDETITGLSGALLRTGHTTQHRYTNITPTLDIYVWEFEDGTIEFSYSGKRTPE